MTAGDHPGWRDWFLAYAPAASRTGPLLEFNASLLAAEAARMGQGVALMRRALVASDLAAGVLEPVFGDHDLPTHRRYALVVAPEASTRARAFAQWFADTLGSPEV